MAKKIIMLMILIVLMIVAEITANLITIDFIIKIFYVGLGIGILYLIKEELL